MSAPVHGDEATAPAPVCAGTDFASRESVIERGLSTFIDVGTALAAIRDERQYREAGWTSFEDYCEVRWGMKRAQAYRLIDAASVAEIVSPIGDVPSESVARELAPLRAEPERAREAWAQTVERHGPTPTAAQVREVVRAEDPQDDPATAWFKAGEKAQRERVSELYRLVEGVRPVRRADLDLLAEQVVRMERLERQMLSGVADTFERTACEIRRLLEPKLGVVK